MLHQVVRISSGSCANAVISAEVEPGQMSCSTALPAEPRIPMIIFLPKHFAEVNSNPITFPESEDDMSAGTTIER